MITPLSTNICLIEAMSSSATDARNMHGLHGLVTYLGLLWRVVCGDPPNIFIDDQTPIGTNFVNHLASALARSKVMVALLSKDYFTSGWCIHELDLMMERAQGYDQIIPDRNS
jgi:hypothetical protein